MSARIRVSVITPTRNRRALLLEAMDSVAVQTLSGWEHIIVDDGSDDGTKEAVARRADADARVRYIERRGDRAGANVCRNLGMQHSRADLLVFLDSDDLLGPRCLEERVAAMARNTDLDFAVFRARVFRERPDDSSQLYHEQLPGDDLSRFLSLECPWQSTGPIWRKSFLTRLGGFEESLLSMQDLDLHVRALAARARYTCYPQVDHYIRGLPDEGRTSHRHFTESSYIEGAELAQRRLFDAVANAGLLTWSRRRALLGLSFGTAQNWVRSGDLRHGFRSWRAACLEQSAHIGLRAAGYLMLGLTRPRANETGFAHRVINKWKGTVRFRQEPSLPDAHGRRSSE